MAALLKKRVLAEYSQTIQEDAQPQKRLRLVYKPTQIENPLQLHNAQSSCDILARLLRYEQRLPTDSETVENDTRELLSHYDRERDDTVRCKIVTVIRELAKVPGADCESLIDSIMSILKNEKSHKVVAQWLKTLQVLGGLLPSNLALHSQIISTATQWLTDTNMVVRASCIELLGVLSPPDHTHTQTLLGLHTNDSDSRVRTASLRALLTLHERGIKLAESHYATSASCLQDDTECVRLAAVKLIWVVSQIYAKSPAAGSDTYNEITLLDDGFVKICNTINDVSCVVRTEAASLLGSLHNVSPRFLRQTLDKKLMSMMRRKVSAHERARESFVSGEWATGQRWASDAPREDLNPEDISLMNIGACGAFVHGLEDEFLEVRNAALDSLCELGSQNPMFAVLSQDSIIDMFNDEIESVRLNAINSLRKISQHIVLREDQLEIILGVLQDFSPKSRETLREMLGDMRLATKTCLTACVMSLLDNLNRYPQDKLSVLRLMQRFGQNHPELTSAIMPDVLSIHPYFATPEPNMQDPNYMSILVMVVNAASQNPSMLSLFQEHTWTHYRYLRSSMPHITPMLQNKSQSTAHTSTMVSSTSATYISSALTRLADIGSMDLTSASQLLEITIRDLSPDMGPQYKLLQGSKEHSVGSSAQALLNKVLKSCDELKHVYVGLGCEEVLMIAQTELKTLALGVMSEQQCGGDGSGSAGGGEEFLACLAHVKQLLHSSNIPPDPFTSAILQDPHLSTSLSDALHSCRASIRPRCFTLSNQIRRITVTVTEPASSILDKPIKFTAGMTASATLIAVVENLADLSDIRVQISYPDSHTDYMAISSQDITKLSPLKHRLNTHLILSHCLTSEPFEVEVCLVLLSKSPKLKLNSSKDIQHTKLCKCVKISLAPKSSRR